MFNKKLVTIWSAPNYCYRCNNIASILKLDENLNRDFKKFDAASHESRVIPAKKPIPEYFLWFYNYKLYYNSIINTVSRG